MSHPFSIVIPGDPVAKARPRFARRGSFTVTYRLDREIVEEGKFALHTRAALAQLGMFKPIPAGTPVKITCTFMFQIPNSWSKKKKEEKTGALHTQKPDL